MINEVDILTSCNKAAKNLTLSVAKTYNGRNADNTIYQTNTDRYVDFTLINNANNRSEIVGGGTEQQFPIYQATVYCPKSFAGSADYEIMKICQEIKDGFVQDSSLSTSQQVIVVSVDTSALLDDETYFYRAVSINLLVTG